MKNILLLLFITLIISPLFSQIIEFDNIKFRKLSYNDFKEISINDTSAAVIDLFFSKKDNAIFNQMSLLPFSIVLVATPTPAQVVGLGSLAISGPLFVSGSYTLLRYRKRKLYTVLTEYKKNKTLPKWVRKKANKLLEEYSLQQINY